MFYKNHILWISTGKTVITKQFVQQNSRSVPNCLMLWSINISYRLTDETNENITHKISNENKCISMKSSVLVGATSERSGCVLSSTSASLYRVGTGVTSSLALFLSLHFISSTWVVVGSTAWLCPFVCCSISSPSVVILAAHDLLYHLQ